MFWKNNQIFLLTIIIYIAGAVVDAGVKALAKSQLTTGIEYIIRWQCLITYRKMQMPVQFQPSLSAEVAPG